MYKWVIKQGDVYISKFNLSRVMGKVIVGAHADSNGPDQTARPRRLIRAVAVRLQNYCIL